jgi:hypothetical protein
MGTAEPAVDSPSALDAHVAALARAGGPDEVVDAVRSYLAAWPQGRVASVQRVDGGWAPFDECQRPIPVDTASDVYRIRNAVHDQCRALRAGGMQLTAALLELDLLFLFAGRVLEDLEQGMAPAGAAVVPARPDKAVSRRSPW